MWDRQIYNGNKAGIEFLVTPWLNGFANYSYQEIGQTITELNSRAGPRFKANAGFRMEWENGLSGEITDHYHGAVTYPIAPVFLSLVPFGATPPDPRVGSYNLVNFRGGYQFLQQKAAAGYMRLVEAAISLLNALNDRRKEYPLGILLGAGFWDGLRLNTKLSFLAYLSICQSLVRQKKWEILYLCKIYIEFQ